MTKKELYNPEKAFARDLAKLDSRSSFAGQEILNFNSLYGSLTAPESNYIFTTNYGAGTKTAPYLMGNDSRDAGEIWQLIEPAIEKRTKSILDSGVRECDVLIAKELILPKRFIEEVEQYEITRQEKFAEIRGKSIEEQGKDIEQDIQSGKLFDGLEKSNNFYRNLIRILKEDGAELSDNTVIGVYLHPGEEKRGEPILNDAFSVLEREGYGKTSMKPLSIGLWYEREGCARADMYDLCNTGEKFVGEVKFILPTLPCGKNYLQKNIEWHERRNANPKTEIPCGFIKGQKNCAPAWCHGRKHRKQ